MKDKQWSKLTKLAIVMVTIFIYNQIAVWVIEFLQEQQPKAYQIPTNSWPQLMTFVRQDGGHYLITGIGYLGLWGVYVTLGLVIWGATIRR